jgi:hypothetical protein
MILCGYFLHYAITCPKSILVYLYSEYVIRGTGYCVCYMKAFESIMIKVIAIAIPVVPKVPIDNKTT